MPGYKNAVFTLMIAMLGGMAWSQGNYTNKISEDLRELPGTARVMIGFAPYGFDDELHHMSKDQRGLYVYDRLKQHASATQRPAVEMLESMGLPYRSYSVVNMISTTLNQDQMKVLASIGEVISIVPDQPFYVEEPIVARDIQLRSSNTEWGLSMIRADSVWAMGIRGKGVVVGGADTGYEWYHPAISNTYRGNNEGGLDHNYNWYDAVHEISPLHGDTVVLPENNPCGLSSAVPCDDHGHGTHTMGTMVGQVDDDMMGVAPEAQWIGCRNMERGYGSPATYIECFEWFLAPTDTAGLNPDPLLAPDVINNSWSCPTMEGCNQDNFEFIRQAIVNLRAAGVVVVVSAGNSGSGCSSVVTPPAMFAESFTVGATNNRDTIAGFSSRGPVTIDSSFRIKPDVVAPGVSVRSAWLDSTYRYLNGTSMAGPHVAGTVALMISANPELRGQVEVIENILRETAVPLTTEQECHDLGDENIPNNTYGFGRIDALAAVEEAMKVTAVDDPYETRGTQFVITPNPTGGFFSILAENGHNRLDLMIHSLQGQLIKTYHGVAPGQQLEISDMVAGMYTLTAFDTDSGILIGTQKLVLAK